MLLGDWQVESLEKWRLDEWGILLNCAKLFSSNSHKQIQQLRNRKPLPDSPRKKRRGGIGRKWKRSTRSCCQGILKLHKSSIYVVLSAEMEIKLHQDQMLKKNQDNIFLHCRDSLINLLLTFLWCRSTNLSNNFKSIADLYSCLFDIGNSVLFHLLFLKDRNNLIFLHVKHLCFISKAIFTSGRVWALGYGVLTLEEA